MFHIISIVSTLAKECSFVIDDAVGIIWLWYQCQWHQMNQKSCSTSFQLSGHYNTIGIMWLQHQCQWHHMMKTHDVTSHFGHLCTINVVLSFTMPLALCDVSTGANSITSPKKSWCNTFWANKCSCDIDSAISNQWCKWQYQMHHMMQKSCWTAFLLTWLNKCSGAIDNAIVITCCWCLCQWYHMTKMLCCIIFWSSRPNKWNGRMELMTLLTPCDIDTSINAITLWCTLFQLSWQNEHNGTIGSAIGITWCWCQWQ